MATGFSVMDALNKNSKAGVDESPRARFRTKDISIFKMYRNKLNFYDLADIEELAGDILMYGLKQNLEVVFEPNEQGEYRIVAGERRWLALKHLVEQGSVDESNTAPEGYDVPHPEKAWKPSRHGKVCINEGTSRKVRMIEKPRYNYEQVIHHIVVSACYDIFMKGMYEFSCGSVPNRGAHYGKKYIERWIQRDKKNCKYVLKMDIRHFCESGC